MVGGVAAIVVVRVDPAVVVVATPVPMVTGRNLRQCHHVHPTGSTHKEPRIREVEARVPGDRLLSALRSRK